MQTWSTAKAKDKLRDAMTGTGLQFSEMKMYADGGVIWSKSGSGIRLSKHKKTWERKREEGYLIRIEYVWNGKTIFTHTEPWGSFPSNQLVAKMMLLPREVSE